ncbi:MAG: endonuclease MutS2 [Saprospiraceae bacterium]|nr:endonuclease MutS2 [Saprospiraceae bacterium]
MRLEPKDLYEKLEFDKISALLEKECLGELGKKAVKQLPFLIDKKQIELQLKEVYEYKLSLSNSDRFPLATYEDLAEDLKMLDIEDYVLSEEGFRRINAVLVVMGDVFKFFTPERQKIYPTLFDILRPVTFDKALAEAIGKVFDEEGGIRPDASPELQRIRRQIGNKERELDKVFRSLINTYRSNGWLTDNVESIRNNRRVFSVPSEHKRKIRGIIHDESATGRTAFIEPEPVIEINNDIFDLQQDERREIWRILKELSATLRPYTPSMRQYLQLLTRFDVIMAKARLAYMMNAQMPKIKKGPHLGTEMGRHPLLYLKNINLGRETVPFDLQLFGDNRIVVLSGPNAGGKSILMKSVGLLQLMMQSGMLVPMDEISEMGIFENIFADIGDQQSIEDDLSTYSGRLVNMRNLLEFADGKTLVLIDEFGSGTDPKMGGAIAEAILKELNERKVYGVITTHYSNLKMFAFKNKGIVNGSMLFDQEHLAPTYMFKVGRPGSSYAFEIGQKSGLSPRVLNYARKRTGKNEMAVDELLIDLQREKKEVEDKLATMTEREKQLEKLIKNYEELQRDLEYRRKKFKLEAKEQALQEVARDNKELERLVREIREEQNLEKAKQLVEQQREERKKAEETVMALQKEVYETPAVQHWEAKKGSIQPGDFVKMRSGGATGTVESVGKNSAIVIIGQMRMTVKLRDLEQAREPMDVRNTSSIQSDTVSQNAGFDNNLDIRGMTPQDALKVVEDFVDRALMTSANQLRIVHGKGMGVLRNTVREKLREYRNLKQVYHPANDEGGDGVTLVEL